MLFPLLGTSCLPCSLSSFLITLKPMACTLLLRGLPATPVVTPRPSVHHPGSVAYPWAQWLQGSADICLSDLVAFVHHGHLSPSPACLMENQL